jgi:hypothetical protein
MLVLSGRDCKSRPAQACLQQTGKGGTSGGAGVYFARAMLLAVDTLPVRYVNDCEFTDTEGSGKTDEEEVNNQVTIINLVQNGDFELFSICPDNAAQIDRAINWKSASNATPEYYNSCSSNADYSVPSNIGGSQNARSGSAYAAIITFNTTAPANGREYIQTKLLQPLIAQKKYIVEFYLSLADYSAFAGNNIGAYISTDSIYGNSIIYLPFIPQIIDTNIMSNKDEWVRIQGDFVASGNEQYLTIGNFSSDLNTNFISDTGSLEMAYYYIDDVSLVLDTTTGIKETNSVEVKVYPNPAKNELYLQVMNTKERVSGTLKLYDVLGNLVMEQSVNTPFTTLNLQAVRAGVYLYSLELNDTFMEHNRIVIIK